MFHSVMSKEDIANTYTVLDKDIFVILKVLKIKNEVPEYYAFAVYNHITWQPSVYLSSFTCYMEQGGAEWSIQFH